MKTAAPRVTQALAITQVLSLVAITVSRMAGQIDIMSGFIPARLGGLAVPGALPLWITPLTATLVHAGLLHLVFNLMVLIFCGREDEIVLGGTGVIVLYIVGAYAAAAGQYVMDPTSIAPMVGSSGAVSALVGAYVLLYGRLGAEGPISRRTRWLHILWLGVAWVGIQFLLSLAWRTEGVVIAGGAHVGGFIAGMALAKPLVRWRYRER